MDADEHTSDNNGESNAEETVFNNNLDAGEESENKCEKSDENKKTGQDTTITYDKDNSKSIEGAEPEGNDNGTPTTERDTANQSKTGQETTIKDNKGNGKSNEVAEPDKNDNGSSTTDGNTEKQSQTGQDTTIAYDKDNSKSIEGAEPEGNDNGTPTNERDTANQSKTGQETTIKDNKGNGKSNEVAEPDKNDNGSSTTDGNTEKQSQTGQDTTIAYDKDNSKSIEGAEPEGNDNGTPTNERDTANQSTTGQETTIKDNKGNGKSNEVAEPDKNDNGSSTTDGNTEKQSQTGQDTTIPYDKGNSKSIECAEPEGNDNGTPTTDRYTANQSKTGQETTIKDNKGNGKSNEVAEPDKNDNGSSTNDGNTEKQSKTGQETTIKDNKGNGKSNEVAEPDKSDNGSSTNDGNTEKQSQTGQDTTITYDKRNSKSIECAEPDGNDNGTPTTDRDTANQSKTGQETTIKDNKGNGKSNEVAEPDKNDNGSSTNDGNTEKQSQTGQNATITYDKGNSKSIECAESEGNDNGTPTTDRDTANQSDLATVRRERDEYKLIIEKLLEFIKHPRGETALSENPDCTQPEALQTVSTIDPSVLEHVKRRFHELEEAVSVHKRDLDQEKKHNESFKKMHKDLQEFVTKWDQRGFLKNKPVANVDNVASQISEYYQQLQGELVKYKQELKQLESSLEYTTTKHKEKETSLKKEIDNLKSQLQRKTQLNETTMKERNDQKKANGELAKKQVGLLEINSAQKDEIEAVKNKLDQAHQNINIYAGNKKQYESIMNQLQGTINEQSNQIQQQTSHIRRQDQTIERLQKNIATLEEEHTKLTLRLSKLAGAHLTRNNPNITDLSDVNRPTKLAEKYSELYDNEWTDAYEECTDAWKMDEETCVAAMLDMLRKADAECLKLLQPHRDIIKTLTTVTVTLEKPVVTEDESIQTDLILVDAEVQTEPFARIDELVQTNTTLNLKDQEENEEPMDTNENNTREESSLEMTEVSGRSQCQQCDSSCSTETPVVQATQVGDQHPEGPAASNVTENQDGTKEQPNEEEQTVQDQMAPMVTDQQFKSSLDTEEVTHAKEQTLNMTENQDRSEMQPNDKEEQLDSSNRSFQDKPVTHAKDQPSEEQASLNMTEKQDRSETQPNDKEEQLDSSNRSAQPAVKIYNQPFESNVDTGETSAELIIKGDFTEEQKKAVSDMRKLCGTKLEEEGSISKIIAMKIAIERGIDINSSGNVMTYITKCAQLCWYMAIQEPPVVIGFRETAADEDFDKDVYKAYTKVGKKVDFVVWPPVYLYKDGPMLCKGTAQGKD